MIRFALGIISQSFLLFLPSLDKVHANFREHLVKLSFNSGHAVEDAKPWHKPNTAYLSSVTLPWCPMYHIKLFMVCFLFSEQFRYSSIPGSRKMLYTILMIKSFGTTNQNSTSKSCQRCCLVRDRQDVSFLIWKFLIHSFCWTFCNLRLSCYSNWFSSLPFPLRFKFCFAPVKLAILKP